MSLSRIYRKCRVQGDCRIWKGGLSRNGYPYIHCPEKHARNKQSSGKGGSSRSGRRVVWKLKHGEEASGVVVMTCNNKLCLWHGHMVNGTRSDMLRLASERGALETLARVVSRTANMLKSAKLDHAKAQAIRDELAHYGPGRNGARLEAMKVLAQRYGVSLTAIRQVYTGQRWKKAHGLAGSSVWAFAANDGMRAAA